MASFLQAPASPTAAGDEQVSVNPINGGGSVPTWGVGWTPEASRWWRSSFRRIRERPWRSTRWPAGSDSARGFWVMSRRMATPCRWGSVRLTNLAGGWTRAEFPLRQALRTFFPSGRVPVVEQLFLANLSTRPELIAGLTANPRCVFRWRRVSPGASPRIHAGLPSGNPQERRGAGG